MLHLKTSESNKIAQLHFDGVQFFLNQVLDYYINAFDILLGNQSANDAINILYNGSSLNAHTLNYLGGRLCFEVTRKEKIKKSKVVGVFRRSNKNINKLFLSNKSGFRAFFDFLKINLEKIIVSEPKDLISIETELKSKFRFIQNADGTYQEAVRTLLLLGIFNYNKFSDKLGLPMNNPVNNYWERYDLAKALNVNTCAYCNRIYTFTVFKNNGIGIISPTIDHFFDKSKHPLFALSFYNLIPSCTNCNSTLKLDKKFTLPEYVHPYLGGFGENAKFNYNVFDAAATRGESANLEVKIKPKTFSPIKTQIENSIELFQLEKIYSEHADYVQELIKKKIISSSRYLEILRNETYKHLDLSLEESYRLAFGNYFHDKDFQRRPLAKLTKDLAEELKMI